ncbi:hypothetical protein M1373_01425 [Candidatus Marsarchaeota archaeon]|nr:hypothetical protein [Candidatus Marsarchaeota archaeon]MCL5404958.1 hypothetical protein [Candidatus Marsarchaeota archaeon]
MTIEEVYLPYERAMLLKQKHEQLQRLEEMCRCKISFAEGNLIQIEGEGYDAYVTKEVVFAFGRGFGLRTAELLLKDDYYFSSIDIKGLQGSKKRVLNIKSRLIGTDGRAKKYIEGVSSAHIAVYGDTICFIGSVAAISEAETAAKTIINGGSHRLAYKRMEAAHRKNKNSA